MRTLDLTPELIARVPPAAPTDGRLQGRDDLPSEAEWGAVADALLAGAPASGEVWIFAFGSLIWNPGFDYDAEVLGTVHGWHRSFCLGWVRIYRGTPDRPGVMLALDHGGACRGVAFRLPMEARRENLLKVLRRELPLRWEAPLVRWMNVATDGGNLRAIGFPIDRSHPAYLPGVTEDQVVEALATAAGERGSMAEYLASTVTHLEARGIHDTYLWRMQKKVAAAIARHWPEAASGSPG